MNQNSERIALDKREASWSQNQTLKNYSLEAIIGCGAFGTVYKANDRITGRMVAIKVEEIVDDSPTLAREFVLFKELRDAKYTPKIYSFHKIGKDLVLVMDLLGPNLIDFIRERRSEVNIKKVIEVGDQLLAAVGEIHSRGIIHRDIKLENVLFGRGENSNRIYLVDFGLSKFLKDDKGQHIPFKTGKKIIGTTKYASIFTHEGLEQSRRDDLECVFYTLLSFMNVGLPWKTVPEKLTPDETASYIEAQKRKLNKETISKMMNQDFYEYFSIVRKLGFEEAPDYLKLRRIISKSLPWTHPIALSLFKTQASSQSIGDESTTTGDNSPNSIADQMSHYTAKQPHEFRKVLQAVKASENNDGSPLKKSCDTFASSMNSPNFQVRFQFTPIHTYQREPSSDRFSMSDNSEKAI